MAKNVITVRATFEIEFDLDGSPMYPSRVTMKIEGQEPAELAFQRMFNDVGAEIWANDSFGLFAEVMEF